MPNIPATDRICTKLEPGDVARAEDPQRHERRGRRRLTDHEGDQQRDRDRAEGQRRARAPAVLGRRLDHRVDEQHQRAGDQHGARDVGPARKAGALVVGQQAHRQHGGDDPDRHVDEEDPVPVDGVGQHTAGQQADRAARRGDEGEDADRLGLLGGLGNIVTIIPRMTAEVIAPPTPWMKRAITSIASLLAKPQTIEESVKTASPARKTPRREIRSPSRPASSSRPPKAIR